MPASVPTDHSDNRDPIRQALWFGPTHRPLFGHLHLPASGQASVGVVLCPSLSVEAASAGPTLRYLADLLAVAGMAAFRFDYDGTGNSAGCNDDPDRVAAWTGSVSEAVAFVRGLGLRVAVVGYRVGGTLAAVALDRETTPVDRLVLWDPCPSGRAFLRQQTMLAARIIQNTPRDDGAVETPGMLFTRDSVIALDELRLDRTVGPIAPEVLVLTRVDRPVDRLISSRLSLAHVTWGTLDGQSSLVDVEPYEARIPETDLAKIVTWLCTSSARQVSVSCRQSARTIIADMAHDISVVESTISLFEGRLFGIVTEPDTYPQLCQVHGAERIPVLVFLNAGVLDHIGPARLWVEWSRRWASFGVRCVRFDLLGNGDSTTRRSLSSPGKPEFSVADQIDHVLNELTNGTPSNAVLIGLCSGGFHAFQAGSRQKLGGICTVNPNLTINFPIAATTTEHQDHSKRIRALPIIRFLEWILPGHDFRAVAIERLPSSVWWLLKWFSDVDVPATQILEVVSQGTPLFVAVNGSTARVLSLGGQLSLARAVRQGTYTVCTVDEIDHTLFGSSAREQVTESLTDYVNKRFTFGFDQPKPTYS